MPKSWDWRRVSEWTFLKGITTRQLSDGRRRPGWGERPRAHGAYTYPDDPSLMAEVLYRGFVEGA